MILKAMIIPFPGAIDNHQMHNARKVTDAGGGWLLEEGQLEADYLGIIFSSLAGYNIEESYKVWERMQKESGASPSEFFSTHPSPDNRISRLKSWIPIVSSQYPAIG